MCAHDVEHQNMLGFWQLGLADIFYCITPLDAIYITYFSGFIDLEYCGSFATFFVIKQLALRQSVYAADVS